MTQPEVRVRIVVSSSDKLSFERMLSSFRDDDKPIAWNKGDKVAGTALERKNFGLAIQTEFVGTWHAGDLAEEFVLRHSDDLARALAVSRDDNELSVEIKIQVTAYDRMPSICIGETLVTLAKKLNASFDVDVILAE